MPINSLIHSCGVHVDDVCNVHVLFTVIHEDVPVSLNVAKEAPDIAVLIIMVGNPSI
jgi:hypothetical protein